MTTEAQTERVMQDLATRVGDALTEVFGGRQSIGSARVRVVDAQEAVCRVFDTWLDERWSETSNDPFTAAATRDPEAQTAQLFEWLCNCDAIVEGQTAAEAAIALLNIQKEVLMGVRSETSPWPYKYDFPCGENCQSPSACAFASECRAPTPFDAHA